MSKKSVHLQCVFHSIRFKVNKGWSTAVLLFLCPKLNFGTFFLYFCTIYWMNKHIHLLWSSVYSYAQRIALLDKAIQLSGKRWPVCHRDCVSFYSWICRMACCTCTVCCFVLFYCWAMHYTYKQIWLINFPVMMSILMEQLINITDAVFLGHVGEVELGASAIAGIYYLAVYMLGLSLIHIWRCRR